MLNACFNICRLLSVFYQFFYSLFILLHVFKKHIMPDVDKQRKIAAAKRKVGMH